MDTDHLEATPPAEESSVASILAASADDEEKVASVLLSDFECPLCCCMLFDPLITDGCGHAFCRHCLHRSLEVKRFCPLCRAPCSMDALSHPTCAILANLTQRLFPAEYAARRREAEEAGQELRRRAVVPRLGLFVSCSPHFPLAPLQLHIFEPRYRVMVNRAMASTDRTFIVVCVDEQRPALPLLEQQRANTAVDVVRLGAEEEERKEGGGDGTVPAPAPLPAVVAVDASALPVGAPRPMGSAHVLDPLRFHPPPFLDARAPEDPLIVREGDIGCVVKIRSMRAHADGRSFVDCIGLNRVRIKNVRREDEGSFGLLSGEVEVIADIDETEEKDANEQQQPQQPQEEESKGTEEPELSSTEEKETVEAALDSSSASSSQGLRNRRPLVDSAGSSSSAAFVTPVAALPVAAAAASSSSSSSPSPTVAELVAECRTLLNRYCALSGFSLERLALMHGGPCPSDDHPTDLSWWLLRSMPDQLPLKAEALACTNLRRRLQMCVELLLASCEFAQARTQTQTRFVGIIVLLAVLMIYLRQYHYIQ